MNGGLTFADLFCGIGGMRLGLERAGMQCAWACEIDDFCRRVYLKHWPDTEPFYDDIRTITDPPTVDLVCGGFPCQDLSLAGKRAGITGERSGLWSEMHRIIRTIRPRYALVENVPGLLVSGMERVLGDLAEIGYDAEWRCISGSSIGAPHFRNRVFVVAYTNGERRPEMEKFFYESTQSEVDSRTWNGRCVDQSSIERVAYGIPRQLDRLKSLGNAVVPQVVEWIGRRIMEANL